MAMQIPILQCPAILLPDGGRSIRSIIGCVPKRDIVYDDLTLEHMLVYSAKLRMPKNVSAKEVDEKISEVLDIVELTAHRKALICKLSGDQKKRTSVDFDTVFRKKVSVLEEYDLALLDTGSTSVMTTGYLSVFKKGHGKILRRGLAHSQVQQLRQRREHV